MERSKRKMNRILHEENNNNKTTLDILQTHDTLTLQDQAEDPGKAPTVHSTGQFTHTYNY